MSYDISNEIDIIQNSARGEDVRDAIISLFQKVNESSIGVTLTTAQYSQLTEEEKNNGTMYFVSDMSLEDGENTYYGDDTDDSGSNYVIVPKQTVLDIVNAVRTAFSINSNMKLSHISALISDGPILVKRYAHLLTGSYNSGATWYYRPTATKQYTIDIYKVPVGNTYVLGIGKQNGNRFYASVFKTDPIEATANLTGTSIISTNSPTAFATSRISITWTDVEYAYIVIQTSNNSNNDADSFVVNGQAIENAIQEHIAFNEDEYEEDD